MKKRYYLLVLIICFILAPFNVLAANAIDNGNTVLPSNNTATNTSSDCSSACTNNNAANSGACKMTCNSSSDAAKVTDNPTTSSAGDQSQDVDNAQSGNTGEKTEISQRYDACITEKCGTDATCAADADVVKTCANKSEGTDDTTSSYNKDLVSVIQGWANWNKQNAKDNGGDVEQTGCTKIFSQELLSLIKSTYRILCTIVIVILVFLMAADFIKVITAGNDDEMPKAIKRSRNRIIATIILFFIPVVLDLFLNYLNLNFHVDGNNTIKIGTVADCKSSE